MQVEAIYILPGRGSGAGAAFEALRRLLGWSQGEKLATDEPEIRLTSGMDGMTRTIFRLALKACQAELTLRDDQGGSWRMPKALWHSSAGREALGFREVEAGLTLIKGQDWRAVGGQVDHTGVCFPSSMAAGTWNGLVDFMGARTELYEYPAGVDGYRPGPMRWLFAVPQSGARLPQPKFEMTRDRTLATPIVQIDIEVGCGKAELSRVFGNRLFSLPGLENVLASLPVRDFGVDFRMDLRFDADAEWTSARFLRMQGKRIFRSSQLAPAAGG